MEHFKTFLICLCICLILLFNNVFAQNYKFWGNLEQGHYKAGFKIVNEYDYSRSWYPNFNVFENVTQNEKGRPIKIYIWYPSEDINNSEPMLFERYMFFMADDYAVGLDKNRKIEMEDLKKLNLLRTISEEKISGLLNSGTKAYNNAIPSEKKFPVLVFGQGLYYESPVTHFILCEYLASHGYIVITSPLVGTYSRQVNLDLIDFETQIRDMEFLVGYGSSLSYADKYKMGVIGYDLGGLSALILQNKNNNVDVFVSLDNGIIMEHNLVLLRQSPYYKPDMLRVPVIHFTRKKEDHDLMGTVENLTVFEQSKFSDIYLLRFKRLQHVAVTSYSVFGLEKPVPMYWGNLSKNAMATYEIICRYILHFLNGYLKEEQKSFEFLNDNLEDHIPGELNVSIWRKKGIKKLPDEGEFLNVIFEEGIKKAVTMFKNVKKKYPNYVIFKEQAINLLGYILMYKTGEIKKAIEIFKLVVEAYPNSANAYDSLGEAYMKNGDNENAIKNYRKSLELNPKNTNAKEILEKLEKIK